MKRTAPGTLVVILAATAVIALIACVVDCQRKSDCEDRGGTVEHYNFHTIYVPMSCGSGCTMIVPEEVSDWRCAGATR